MSTISFACMPRCLIENTSPGSGNDQAQWNHTVSHHILLYVYKITQLQPVSRELWSLLLLISLILTTYHPGPHRYLSTNHGLVIYLTHLTDQKMCCNFKRAIVNIIWCIDILSTSCEFKNKRPVGLSSFVNCPPVVASILTQRQLSVNARWQHMGRVPHPNYVDPECCIATVCHQVRFMYWEHLGHFHRAISHIKWHKIVCMRYLACTFSQMKSTDMFSMYLQSGVPRHFIWCFYCGLNIELHCFHVYCM